MSTPQDTTESVATWIRKRSGMFYGTPSSAGLQLFVQTLLDEILGAPGAQPSNADITLQPDHILIEFRGQLPDLSPADFAGESVCPSFESPFLFLIAMAALSEEADVEFARGDSRWRQRYSRGVPLGPTQGDTSLSNGLRIRFRPDPEIFGGARVMFLPLAGRIQDLAVCQPATCFRIEDEHRQPRYYHYPQGLISYMTELEQRPIPPQEMCHLELADGSDRAQAVIVTHAHPLILHSFVNGRRTYGGSHVLGLTRAIADLASIQRNGPDCSLIFTRDPDPCWGMTVLLALELAKPSWASPYHDRLGGERPEELVYRMVRGQFLKELARSSAARLP